MTAWMNVK